MGTDYYSGDYSNQFNAGTGYYPNQQTTFTDQNYSMTPNYPNNYATQGFNQNYYNQNAYNPTQAYGMNQMNQGYMGNANYPAGFGSEFNNLQTDQFNQQPPVSQQIQNQSNSRPKSAPQRKCPIPLEIRGGVKIPSCHCAKKNGLQDHCARSICKIENENKRRRQIIWPEFPTKDNNQAMSAFGGMSPSGDANNLVTNPAYNESFDNQIVPSNAVPYNTYGM